MRDTLTEVRSLTRTSAVLAAALVLLAVIDVRLSVGAALVAAAVAIARAQTPSA